MSRTHSAGALSTPCTLSHSLNSVASWTCRWRLAHGGRGPDRGRESDAGDVEVAEGKEGAGRGFPLLRDEEPEALTYPVQHPIEHHVCGGVSDPELLEQHKGVAHQSLERVLRLLLLLKSCEDDKKRRPQPVLPDVCCLGPSEGDAAAVVAGVEQQLHEHVDDVDSGGGEGVAQAALPPRVHQARHHPA
eukprot:CAMPEP_0202842574 /NCGR_PEP_ID=MMETSP1389-20130828/61846_1 /ASSEMBLY_ACC=CAM_ASM_000865 /TAXON_ID=302021 /ORGANISM="Rhodomonas sp., Strain CCMP768" /LENGTH=188 /DNA_ID=CAMNT_0049519581 /DNA_START=176 /DNA_END=739 /DNA_ORIENTATION=+